MPEHPRLTWVGHSTVMVEMGGLRFLTDPLLTDRVAHLRRRRRVDVEPARHADVVLVSHVHADHLHLRSLSLVERRATLVVPPGVAGFVARRGFARVVELAVGASTEIGDVRITAVAAVHGWSRGPHSRLSAQPCGYVLDDGTTSVYFAGDTDLFDDMAAIGPVTVALVPIWGWGSTIGHGHLDPARAVEAGRLLEPDLIVPIHWGTFSPEDGRRRLPRWLDEPAHRFAALVDETELARRLRVLQPGATLAVGDA
ncbi:MAG: MBL fold metallo-hydrolase [Ilumatobacteraceae bacterium]|nr:MBL fold metallo-hydrolase [Ilumatobacteraceae bacterium]